MKKLFGLVACVGLAGCLDAPADGGAATGQTITSESQFRALIVGKTLEFQGNTFSFDAGGTLSGPWDGSGITGTWEWVDGAACREGAISTRQLDLDCQIWAVNGTVATITRDRGAGSSFDYNIR